MTPEQLEAIERRGLDETNCFGGEPFKTLLLTDDFMALVAEVRRLTEALDGVLEEIRDQDNGYVIQMSNAVAVARAVRGVSGG